MPVGQGGVDSRPFCVPYLLQTVIACCPVRGCWLARSGPTGGMPYDWTSMRRRAVRPVVSAQDGKRADRRRVSPLRCSAPPRLEEASEVGRSCLGPDYRSIPNLVRNGGLRVDAHLGGRGFAGGRQFVAVHLVGVVRSPVYTVVVTAREQVLRCAVVTGEADECRRLVLLEEVEGGPCSKA